MQINLSRTDNSNISFQKRPTLAHSEWDRKKREVQAILAQSEANPNTKESRVDTDLRELVAAANKIDEVIVNIEQEFLCNKKLDADSRKKIKSQTDAMFRSMKLATKKAIGLKTWFAI